MTSAIDLISNPELGIDPITATTASAGGYSSDELKVFRIGDADIHNLVLKLYAKAKRDKPIYTNVRQIVLEAEFEDTIEQTPTFRLTLHDPDWELLNSGLLKTPVDINPGKSPGRWYRLDTYDVNNSDISLVFATRNAIYMSMHKKPYKISRNKVTRAQFILTMLRKVKIVKIKFFCPQLKKKQKQEKLRSHTTRQKHNNRELGFTSSDKITVKHGAATSQQRSHIEQVIEAGVDTKAPSLVIVSALMCIIQESEAGGHTGGNPPYVGDFQQNRAMGWPATGDPYKDAKGYYKAAIPAWKKNPNIDLGQFVSNVQGVTGSTNPLNAGYAQSTDRWRDEAQHAVNAYGIDVSDPGSAGSEEFQEKYEFMVGEPDGTKNENYLAAAYRLAEQVGWRFFWVRDEAHFHSEKDLFKSKPRTSLRRDRDGVETVSFSWDRQKRIQQMTLGVRMERWVAPCGSTIHWEEGGDAEGKWLVNTVRRSMFDTLGTIILTKPIEEKLEPINVGSRSTDPTGGSPGSPLFGGIPIHKGDELKLITFDMRPDDIIFDLVSPIAIECNMLTGIDRDSIIAANNAHSTNVSGGGNTSWHKGPGTIQYAVDMSNGHAPTDEMDQLAAYLIKGFELPDLANWQATSGETPGNLVSVEHKGFKFQMIYRTNLAVGGDHYNHVHFGVQRVRAAGGHP